MQTLFEFGLEGAKTTVYLTAANIIVEISSSGGITDQNDDPYNNWQIKYDSWGAYWKAFKKTSKENWIKFYPVFIHKNIKETIKIDVDKYDFPYEGLTDYKAYWYNCLAQS